MTNLGCGVWWIMHNVRWVVAVAFAVLSLVLAAGTAAPVAEAGGKATPTPTPAGGGWSQVTYNDGVWD